MERVIGKTKIKFIVGDITESDTEAIVNAANPTLMGGGGVDGAIHSKGGPEILNQCIQIRKNKYPQGLDTGEAVITTGGNLKAKYVIHTVGPICDGKMDDEKRGLLYRAYQNCLKLAISNSIKTVSFPSISTGAYGCDVEEASKVAVKSIIDFLKKYNNLDEIRFVLYTDDIYNVYTKIFEDLTE